MFVVEPTNKWTIVESHIPEVLPGCAFYNLWAKSFSFKTYFESELGPLVLNMV